MKKVAILQSNYIPWKGYFDIIGSVDEFVLYDDMQYTKNDWRNRNKIKTQNGLQWLSIAVRQESLHQKINETMITDAKWHVNHWKSIAQSYAKAPFFKAYKEQFEALYAGATQTHISEINRYFIDALCGMLDIKTKIRDSREFVLAEGKSERLLALCQELGATTYLSGPAARDYLDESIFEAAGIGVEWMDYGGYKEYHQLFPPFEHGVSVIDLILNEGENAKHFLKSSQIH